MAATRIAFLLAQPTQFDAPFFRFAQSSGNADITVLYLQAEPTDAELDHKLDWGVELFSGYACKIVPAESFLGWLRRELRPDRYDWVVINGYTRLPYACALAIARARGIRTALRIDSVLFNAGGAVRRARKAAAMRLLDRVFDKFLATGSLAREYLEHFGIRPGKIGLFPYLVDASAFTRKPEQVALDRAMVREKLAVAPDARVVLAVAKMNARETPWDLLEALEGLDRADIHTVFVGAGEQLAGLKERVAARRIRNVIFAGYVPYPALPAFYAAADVFVHAATDEPWGVSVHEAIACGLPVIASSRVGAARDLVVQGGNGYVYPLGDSVRLRECLLEALDSLDPAQIARENAQVLERWGYARTWDMLARELA